MKVWATGMGQNWELQTQWDQEMATLWETEMAKGKGRNLVQQNPMADPMAWNLAHLTMLESATD